jgi:hypothetical protein
MRLLGTWSLSSFLESIHLHFQFVAWRAVLVLAEVFRRGTQMHDEQALTV